MKLLSDVLNRCRLRSQIYHNAQWCGKWQLQEHQLGITCFHLVTQGGCHLSVPQHLSCNLNAGDIVIFPYELPHTMTPLQGLDCVPYQTDYNVGLQAGGVGMLCGTMEFSYQVFKGILDALPSVFIISAENSKQWIQPLLDLILYESKQNPSKHDGVIVRLSEVLFIKAIESYALYQNKQQNIFSLYAHPKLNKAIAHVHKHPSLPHQVESLANIAGMSRTSFSNLFKQVSHWSPMYYVAWYRMQLAYELLSQGLTVANVAEQVGYASEAAFAQVFKKHCGVLAGQVKRLNTETA